ncbi:adenosylcobyric acid synthase [Anaerosolibacter carboniphilus]|uniref:Cobyric acid synthase n=1 Tax=Anaerosolibacter carboniphilus TaxID=1417629 RepID=A0A841KMD9_9FIRM|nr:cobyric acid synthase [Anaerosolibacter carboniphilus]MBB6214606.1 adenosylcobyric acid synthase [Anaerosolibacter carboniphilus]
MMKTKKLMLQGTGSSVGKSLLTAGFCRIFHQDGHKVAPFKSQNMALNSFITAEGLEMGRAQVVQAEASKIEPTVAMNPVLLKPTTDKKCQVILNGKVFKNMSAVEYHEFKPELAELVKKSFQQLEYEHDVVVIEGAGSPAEINLRENDIVNMGMAEMVDSPVILIGDIDRGGVFASLAGTMLLLTEEEKKRVKGVIINKFRGDVEILKPGIKMLEDIIKIPVLGVIPYYHVQIEDEDSLAERFRYQKYQGGQIEVAVLYLPHVSNFTDFNVFETQEDVNLRYVMRGESIGNPDILIIPGSKNTIEDLVYIRESGLEEQILRLHRQGKLIVGICGGYQMLGKTIKDPYGTESSIEEINGLGLLDVDTLFEMEKTTTQVEAVVTAQLGGLLEGIQGASLKGYEIHMGKTVLGPESRGLNQIRHMLGKDVALDDGAANMEGNVIGTYIHGIFDNIPFTRAILNNIRRLKGLEQVESSIESFEAFKEQEYDKLAEVIRTNLDMKKVYQILNGEEICSK